MKKALRWILAAVLVLGLAAGIAYRLWQSDRSRSIYCRLLPCSKLEALDRLCSFAAEAEFVKSNAPLEHLREAAAGDGEVKAELDALLALNSAQRYPALLDRAKERGGVVWSCPAIERTLAIE